MKRYFMQSDIYKKFEKEQESELVREEECENADSKLHNLQSRFTQLQQRYNKLKKNVEDQD